MFPLGRFGLYTLLIALPVAVEIPSDPDSAATRPGATRVSALMGVGTWSLVERGCGGEVIRSRITDFRDVTGAIEHEFPNGFVSGVRGGTLEEKKTFTENYPTQVTIRSERINSYLNPHIGLEQDAAGIGVGWVFPRHDHGSIDGGPSFHARFGRRDANSLVLSYMESMPIYSGGGTFEAALAAHPHQSLDLSVGLTSLPFVRFGVALKADYRVLTNWSLMGRARFGGGGRSSWWGSSANSSLNGAAIGISYSTRPPLPVHRESGTTYVARPGDVDGDGWRSGLEPKEGPEPPSPEPAPTPMTATPPATMQVIIPTTDDGKYPDYGSYQSLDSLAVPITRADPVAPDSTTGTVFVAALVARTGQVVDTRVVKSIPALDAAAVACVRQWTFRPAIDRGRAVASWVTVPVRFGPE